jgi:hypothetical protein
MFLNGAKIGILKLWHQHKNNLNCHFFRFEAKLSSFVFCLEYHQKEHKTQNAKNAKNAKNGDPTTHIKKFYLVKSMYINTETY